MGEYLRLSWRSEQFGSIVFRWRTQTVTRGHVRAVPFARKLVDSRSVPTHLLFLISPYYNPSRPFLP